jgi:Protein of unknown function (DUF2778)
MSHETGAMGPASAREQGIPSKGFAPVHRIGIAAVAGLLACCGWTAFSNIRGADLFSPSSAAAEATISSLGSADVVTPHSRKQDRSALSAAARMNFTDRFPEKVAALSFNDRFSASAPTSVASSNEVLPPPSASGFREVPHLALRVPLPSKRPSVAYRSQKPHPGPSARATEVASAPAEEPTIFEKLFGTNLSPLLAYASADPGIRLDERPSLAGPQPYDRHTAVYDISARTVYLPDGTKLEAHSGLGEKMDNPSFAHVRMRGPTPPHLYDLTLRESLFHGVQALRLNPVGGEGAIHGRVGLLAHSYMLGVRGDSNGCVSIKDYEAFLRAYRAGQIKRLAVVAKL